jgi:hypothetical protein
MNCSLCKLKEIVINTSTTQRNIARCHNDNYYCEDCTYIFSPHYQFQGARCYKCADQYRISLNKVQVRDNKVRFSLDEDGIIFPL